MKNTVLLIGATEKTDRYAYMATELLLSSGYQVILVGIKSGNIFNNKIYTLHDSFIQSIKPSVITLYINPVIQEQYKSLFLTWQPKHVIFNPGTENPDLEENLMQHNINCMEGCTLVMLKSGTFPVNP